MVRGLGCLLPAWPEVRLGHRLHPSGPRPAGTEDRCLSVASLPISDDCSQDLPKVRARRLPEHTVNDLRTFQGRIGRGRRNPRFPPGQQFTAARRLKHSEERGGPFGSESLTGLFLALEQGGLEEPQLRVAERGPPLEKRLARLELQNSVFVRT
jgi:hypothetical protein